MFLNALLISDSKTQGDTFMIVAVIDTLFPFPALNCVTTFLMFDNGKSNKRPLLIVECSRIPNFSPMTAVLAADTDSAPNMKSAQLVSVLGEDQPNWWQSLIYRSKYENADLLLINNNEEYVTISDKDKFTNFINELQMKYEHIVFCAPEINDLVCISCLSVDKIVVHSIQGFTPVPCDIDGMTGKTIVLTSKCQGSLRKKLPRIKGLFRCYSPGMWDSQKVSRALRRK